MISEVKPQRFGKQKSNCHALSWPPLNHLVIGQSPLKVSVTGLNSYPSVPLTRQGAVFNIQRALSREGRSDTHLGVLKARKEMGTSLEDVYGEK